MFEPCSTSAGFLEALAKFCKLFRSSTSLPISTSSSLLLLWFLCSSSVCTAEVKQAQEAELDALPSEYYREEFNVVLFELQQLPPYFTKEDLDTVVEARASVLEVCSWEKQLG